MLLFCVICVKREREKTTRECPEELRKDGERLSGQDAKTTQVERSGGIHLGDVRRSGIANAICEKAAKSEGTLRCCPSAEG